MTLDKFAISNVAFVYIWLTKCLSNILCKVITLGRGYFSNSTSPSTVVYRDLSTRFPHHSCSSLSLYLAIFQRSYSHANLSCKKKKSQLFLQVFFRTFGGLQNGFWEVCCSILLRATCFPALTQFSRRSKAIPISNHHKKLKIWMLYLLRGKIICTENPF